jgi:hypothetical protein
MEHKQLVIKVAVTEHGVSKQRKGQTPKNGRCRKAWCLLAIALLCLLFLTQLLIAGSLTDTATSASTGTVQIAHHPFNEAAADTTDAPSQSTIATTKASTAVTASIVRNSTSVSLSVSTSTSKNNTQALDQNTTNTTTPIASPYPHPHAGARDANGKWGYKADVTRVRRLMLQRYRDQFAGTMEASLVPPLSYLPMTVNETAAVCDVPPKQGIEGKHGWDVVLKVEVDAHSPRPLTPIHNSTANDTNRGRSRNTTTTIQNAKSNSSNSSPHADDGVSKGKILCGIYTYGKMHGRLIGVTETWGWRCDGFLAASTATIDDPAQEGFPATDLPHEGKEEYDNMWQKTRSILSYMYDHYLDDYDYFYLSGDDTHLIVENLRRFLYETEQTYDVATKPIFMGAKIKASGILFNGGGAGYLLNRVALQRLVLDAFPTCLVHAKQSSEDRFVAMCLQQLNEPIFPLDTVDALGQQRFGCMDANFLGRFAGTFGYFKQIYQDWGKRYGYKTGVNLMSEQSISFHVLRGPKHIRRHHAIMYESCPADTVLAKAVREARTERARQSLSVLVSVLVSNSSTMAKS